MPAFRYDFSVIVPTHNRPEQLLGCLESLAALNFPADRFEVLVVDDGSAPPVESVAEPFRQRLHLTILRQAQAGPATARNRGSAEADGHFLAFTDDDCRPDHEWLGALHTCLRAHPDQLVGGKMINALSTNIYSTTCHLILDAAYDYFDPEQGRAHFFASSNFAMSAEKFRAQEGFTENWSLAAAEDRAFCYRWLQRGGVMTHVAAALVRHHHELDFASFCRLYFRYGRGAYYYQKLRGESSGAGGLEPAWGFYWLCFRRAFTGRNLWQSIALACLLGVWQVANAAGYFAQRFFFGRKAAPLSDGATGKSGRAIR